MSGINLQDFSKKMTTLLPNVIRGFLRKQTDELAKGKISIPQYLVLDFIFSNGVQKMSRLAKEMAVSLPAMSGLIERLHRLGLVKRMYDSKDRRVIKITLTVKGQGVVIKIRTQREKIISKIFGQIAAEERKEYLRILTKVHDVLYKA